MAKIALFISLLRLFSSLRVALGLSITELKIVCELTEFRCDALEVLFFNALLPNTRDFGSSDATRNT
jgi:hypothetical protein